MSLTPTAISWVEQQFTDSIIPALFEYVRIPNKSPAFDPNWRTAGHMDAAVSLLVEWARPRLPAGAVLEVLRLGDRTPLILIDVPARDTTRQDTVLIYGHLDKQPEMSGWRDGLGPWTPVLEGDKLFGRGAADDGYAIFAALTALNALEQARSPHARALILIEASEESGSPDLPAYIEHLSTRLAEASLVVCLDSGCANYEQLWCTTSLRGIVIGDLTASVLTEGIHSGDGTGIVPSSFRIARRALDRLEDAATGEIRLPECNARIPAHRVVEAESATVVLADQSWQRFPWISGLEPQSQSPLELILNRSWRPGLELIGISGVPALTGAGNVLRPSTTLRISVRVPPNVDARVASRAIRECVERDPPRNAYVSFEEVGSSNGWDAPPLEPWLSEALQRASQRHFGKPVMFLGEGGTIPFFAMLGSRFPAAQFCVTGLLGPGSNAHGPNEFLHLPSAQRLTLCVADLLAAHASRSRGS